MTAPLSYFARDKDCIKIFDFDESSETSALVERPALPAGSPTPKAAQWNNDGSALALVDPFLGVQVVTFAPGESQDCTVHSLQGAPKTTQSFLWSPKSSALVTVAPGAKGSVDPNLHVWRKSDNGKGYTLQASFCHPKLEKGAKVIQWTVDEALCARLLPDGSVHILDGSDLSSEPLVDLKMAEPVHDLEFAPSRGRRAAGSLRALLAVFVSDVRDDLQRVVGPAQVVIIELTSVGGAALRAQEKVKTNVAAGQAAELFWNSTGSAVIAHCQTEVDESGQSYYGGSKLVLISSDGECQKDLLDPVEGLLANGGATQAVAWSPTRDEFILIHGFQPSQASLFSWDDQVKKVVLAKVLLEKAHRNTIRFNHFGSLVCLAGFGNLAGQVDFYGRADDADEDNCDFVRVSSCQAPCTVSAEWAPDGRHLLTSVLAPRMRVDNGAHVWRALTGTKVAGTEFEELFDVQWRPEPPESLRFLDVSVEEVQGASKECLKTGADVGGGAKKQAYRPPKARGEGASTVAAMMRGEVAAPDGDDRRKRQSRQPRTRDEDLHPSPRQEDQVSAQEPEQQSQQQSETRSSLVQTPPPPQQHAQNQRQQQGVQAPQGQHAQGAPWNVQQQLRDEQQRQRESQQLQQQRDLQQREQQRGREQMQREQQKQRDSQVLRAADAARISTSAAAGTFPGHPQQRAMQQVQLHQQQAQAQAAQAQAAYTSGAAAQVLRQQLQQHHQLHAQQQVQQQQQQQVARAAQQQATQGHSNHGLKAACPQSGWQYVDPKQNIQGPFTLMEMQQWNSMGYFRPDLPMRCDPADPFLPFSELFPHPLIPFQSYPKRPRGGIR